MNSLRFFFPAAGKFLTILFILSLNAFLHVAVKAADPSYKMDFDGDGKTDIAVFRPGERNVFPLPPSYFYVLSSRTGELLSYQWGRAYDIHTPADYDNDGKTDVGIFRWIDDDLSLNASHYWINYSLGGHSVTPFSGFGNIVSRNYFGDAKAELALFDRYDVSEDPINPCFIMAFFILPQGNDFALKKDVINHCMPEGLHLTPAIGDYNNDGKSDVAVLVHNEDEPAGNYFKVWYSPVSPQYTFQDFGLYLDVDYPIPGDFDGDGKTDFSGSKNSNGQRIWRILQSSDGKLKEFAFGLSDDYPVPGDYDGDGKTDIAVFRRSNSTWYILRSSDGALDFKFFGFSTDIPLTLPNSNIYY
ncbi:MAG: repeat-containing protein [Acidobacteria bacterium]|jgi:hypothetical protein|nr:repeat-containing protein [Acidobacteriota bacterium]